MSSMNAAEIAATRHLLGLSQAELAGLLGVGRDAVKDWERDAFKARPRAIADLLSLRALHDAEAMRLVDTVRDGLPAILPSGPRPRGWYVALGARVLDREPRAVLEWME